MTRRELLLAGTGSLLMGDARLPASRLSVEAYIFQQYAQQQGKQLRDVLPAVIPMAHRAGFQNIELNGEFFKPDCKDQTLSLVRANGLRMPSVYSGGVLHEASAAAATISQALTIAQTCKPFGCDAVVCNATPKGESIEKTDAELATQAEQMNAMGRVLSRHGFELRIHNHTPEMLSRAREWRYTLQHTDPALVAFCLDLDWVHQGDQDPLGLLKEAGARVREIHVRNSKNKLWLEDLEAGDVDYGVIATYLQKAGLHPLVVVELAYRRTTIVTRSLEEDLKISRENAKRIFGGRGHN